MIVNQQLNVKILLTRYCHVLNILLILFNVLKLEINVILKIIYKYIVHTRIVLILNAFINWGYAKQKPVLIIMLKIVILKVTAI